MPLDALFTGFNFGNIHRFDIFAFLRVALSLSLSKTKQEMPHIMMPVVVKNDGAREFVMRGLNGWIVENFSSVVSQLSLHYRKSIK